MIWQRQDYEGSFGKLEERQSSTGHLVSETSLELFIDQIKSICHLHDRAPYDNAIMNFPLLCWSI